MKYSANFLILKALSSFELKSLRCSVVRLMYSFLLEDQSNWNCHWWMTTLNDAVAQHYHLQYFNSHWFVTGNATHLFAFVYSICVSQRQTPVRQLGLISVSSLLWWRRHCCIYKFDLTSNLTKIIAYLPNQKFLWNVFQI